MKKVAPFNLNLVPFKATNDKTGAFNVVNYLTCVVAVRPTKAGEITVELQHADDLKEGSFKTLENQKIVEKLKENTCKQYYFDLTGAKKYLRIVFKGLQEGDSKVVGFGDMKDTSIEDELKEETVS